VKIVAPFSHPNEVEMLLHYGADELYCGIHTPEWEDCVKGRLWMNRRSPRGANLLSWQALAEAISLAHTQNIPVFITLNSPFYPESARKYAVGVCRKAVEEIGADGLIISDIPLLIDLRKAGCSAPIHLSSLAGCINSGTVDFYRGLGISRIILPRQLRPSEIEDLVKRNREQMDFEVFALNDGCFFEEGYCQTTHALNPFCMTDWEMDSIPGHGEDSNSLGNPDLLEKNRTDMKGFLWFLNNCGSSFQDDGLPNGPCSLCLFGHFQDWGVDAVKIVGREASFYRKMRSLQIVKAVMDQIRPGTDPNEIAHYACRLRSTPDLCTSGLMCYFRESDDS